MDVKSRWEERDRLRRLLTQLRNDLDVLIDHVEHDVLPTRMIGASAHHHLTLALSDPAPVNETPNRRSVVLRTDG